MADLPYQRPEERGPETVAMMTEISSTIRKEFQDQMIGVQVLSGGNREALAIAQAADLGTLKDTAIDKKSYMNFALLYPFERLYSS